MDGKVPHCSLKDISQYLPENPLNKAIRLNLNHPSYISYTYLGHIQNDDRKH